MLKQLIGFSLSRHTGLAALLVVLGACNRPETAASGYLAVLPNAAEDSACDVAASGHLQVVGVDETHAISVSGEELCRSRMIHRELPAGLYSVSWRPSSPDSEDGERWDLYGPSVLTVFPGHVTRLRVRQIAPERTLLSRRP